MNSIWSDFRDSSAQQSDLSSGDDGEDSASSPAAKRQTDHSQNVSVESEGDSDMDSATTPPFAPAAKETVENSSNAFCSTSGDSWLDADIYYPRYVRERNGNGEHAVVQSTSTQCNLPLVAHSNMPQSTFRRFRQLSLVHRRRTMYHRLLFARRKTAGLRFSIGVRIKSKRDASSCDSTNIDPQKKSAKEEKERVKEKSEEEEKGRKEVKKEKKNEESNRRHGSQKSKVLVKLVFAEEDIRAIIQMFSQAAAVVAIGYVSYKAFKSLIK